MIKNNAAAGVSSAAASFKNFLALLAGISWGGILTALFADQTALTPETGIAGCKVAAAVALIFLIRQLSACLSPFFAWELLYIFIFGALIVNHPFVGTALILVCAGIFWRISSGEDFAAYRRKFAVGLLLGGAAALHWDLPFAPALVGLLMTISFFLLFSEFRYRKRTFFYGILLCILFLMTERLHLSTRYFSRSVAGEAQGITLIAAAGTPECAGEPKALCVTATSHAAFIWKKWRVFNRFSVSRPGRILPWGEKYDLIFCDRLPKEEHLRTETLFKRLAPGGVLAVPVEVAAKFPELDWRKLPGSNGSFAAVRPGFPRWKIVPEKLDASLFRGKGRRSAYVISPGALTGLLVDFEPGKAVLPQSKALTTTVFPGVGAWGILLIFLLLHAAAFRRPKFSETLSIAENCLGFALIVTLIFKCLPQCFELLPVLVLFFFLYPLKVRNWLLKLIGTLAIAAALLWSLAPGILLAVTALLLTGAEFSTTFNEQMAEKPKAGRIAAVIGLTVGILLAAAAERLPFAFAHIVQAALLFRVWTLIRC